MNGQTDVIDVTSGFEGDVIRPIPLDGATHRLWVYCADPRSGWGPYDLAGVQARRAGALDDVSMWSLLLANALNGQVTLKNLAAFDPSHRRKFAASIGRVSELATLTEMLHAGNLEPVFEVCSFGFPGAWAPKITKVAALYRPCSVPVLDGHIARAFGLGPKAFSNKAAASGRTEWIKRVV